MRRQQSPRSLPLILFFCVTFLALSILLLLPPLTPHSSKVTSIATTIPAYISLHVGEQTFSTPSATLISDSSFAAYTKTPSPIEALLNKFSSQSTTIQSPLDRERIKTWVALVASASTRIAVAPAVEVGNGSTIVVFPGEKGRTVNQEMAVDQIRTLDLSATSSATVPLVEIGKTLTPDAILGTQHFAEKLLGKKLLIRAPHFAKTLTQKELVELLDPPSDISLAGLTRLIDTIDEEVATPSIEPVLEISGTIVTKFIAPKNGQQLDKPAFSLKLQEKVRELTTADTVEPLDLSFISSPPKMTLAQVNTLGISERIGLGESEYAHSIPNRIKNVSLTTSKIHAKLIFPGEEFSFNKYLGEVSAATGFLPAYVIKEGQTVLGDGGGVCQVSSTLFRAILNSGLPVTERRGHSYRVGYYEQNSKPGFDATVFSPHPDLRFKNDTGTPILINAVADPKTLSMYIELWGKSDGRTALISNYKQWGAVSAPPPLYQDDPTLPPGKLKQIDFAAPGLKTSFDYTVTYPNGEVKNQTFATNYIPWRAVYLRGI